MDKRKFPIGVAHPTTFSRFGPPLPHYHYRLEHQRFGEASRSKGMAKLDWGRDRTCCLPSAVVAGRKDLGGWPAPRNPFL
jgi:hypothetical protein